MDRPEVQADLEALRQHPTGLVRASSRAPGRRDRGRGGGPTPDRSRSFLATTRPATVPLAERVVRDVAELVDTEPGRDGWRSPWSS